MLSFLSTADTCSGADTPAPPPSQGLKPHLVMVFFWSIYNMLPPLMFLAYSMCDGKTLAFESFVGFCCAASYVMAAGEGTEYCPLILAWAVAKQHAICPVSTP
jgi:hypothetical protein